MERPRTLDPTREHGTRHCNGPENVNLMLLIIVSFSLSLMIFKNNAFLKLNNPLYV